MTSDYAQRSPRSSNTGGYKYMTRNLTVKTIQRYKPKINDRKLGSQPPLSYEAQAEGIPLSDGVLHVKGRPLAIRINKTPCPFCKTGFDLNRAALGNCTDEPRKATAAGVLQATKKEPGD